MTDEHEDGEQPTARTTDDPSGGRGLAQYFVANRDRFTEDALAAEARRQGYPEATIEAALAQSRAETAPAAIRGRALRWIVGTYLAAYVLLSGGMLMNGREPGYLMPDAGGGITILTGSLVVAFVLSLVWIASRRAFGYLFFGGIAILGLATVILPIIGLAGLYWLVKTRVEPRATVALEVALIVPILMLLGISGICLASGLPIPGGS